MLAIRNLLGWLSCWNMYSVVIPFEHSAAYLHYIMIYYKVLFS